MAISDPSILDQPPQGEGLTAYDEALCGRYLCLLDAEAEGADWREAVKLIFGVDATREPERARRVYDSHLARAHWMTEAGFAHLLAKDGN